MMRTLPALLLAVAVGAAAADPWHRQDAGGLLTPDQAFQLMPVEAHGQTLRIEWEVAPGYYMYLNRLKFEATGLEPGNAQLPAGEKHHDEHFGDVEIFRAGTLVARLPVSTVPQKIKLTYQGCAEIGVCLPPQIRVVDVTPVP